jgi:holo-[acyl-carrier protein] synthase
MACIVERAVLPGQLARKGPLIVGLGVDLIEIARIRESLARRERFIRRVYTSAEEAYCARHRDPAPHYAARFAAKEALMKAIGTGWSRGVRWRDIEVERERGSAPKLVLHGEARRIAGALGAARIHLTLSHSADSAIAVVILES